MTYRSPEDFAKETDPVRRFLRGMIRRMAITLTSGTRWQLLGFRNVGGQDETLEVEVFPGIGFFARPPKTGKPETIAVAPGGPKNLVAIATRDEKTRQAVAGELAEDETAMFNSKVIAHAKADETFEVRKVGGTAVSLAKNSELERFIDALDLAIAAMGGVGFAPELHNLKLALQGLIPPWPGGTEVLQGE